VSSNPPEVEIVLWLNEHHGGLRRDGKGFEDTPPLTSTARHHEPDGQLTASGGLVKNGPGRST